MWSVLSRAIYPNRNQYSSVKGLKYAIENAWYKFVQETIQIFIFSVEDRIYKVILTN